MHLAVRADGNAEIGYGHLTRTSVLAQKFLEEGHKVTYLTRTSATALEVCSDEVSSYPLDSDELSDVLWWLEENKPEFLLTDSYSVDTEYQKKLSRHVPTLATVTDDARFTLCCDININGNVHAPELAYDWTGQKPEMLLGTEYLLLRESFQTLSKKTPPWRDPPERVLVTFGGSDMNSATPEAVRAFDGTGLDVEVIIGPGFTNEGEITEAADETDATFQFSTDPDNLPERMFDADFAVSATGSTVYELLVTGTPVIGMPQTNNQVPIAEGLAALDAIVSLEGDSVVTFEEEVGTSVTPSLGEIDPEGMRQALRRSVSRLKNDTGFRRKLRERGRKLVDGRGDSRVYNRMLENYD